MSLTITAEQRDALYDEILDRLSGIGDVWIAVCSNNYDAAERLGRGYSDDLRLVLDDLGGFGDGSGEPVELTTPPDVLRRVFGRQREQAISHSASMEQDHVEANKMEVQSAGGGGVPAGPGGPRRREGVSRDLRRVRRGARKGCTDRRSARRRRAACPNRPARR